MLIVTGMDAPVQAVSTMTEHGCGRGCWDGGCAPAKAHGRD